MEPSRQSRIRPAIFLDRDGTLIESVHYLSDPQEVRLLPGVAPGLRRLRAAGFACVVVTNQAAVGKGLVSEAQLERIHQEMRRQLDEQGAGVDGIYWCPTPGIGKDRSVVEFHDRKPGPGMIVRAAAEMGLDVAASWMVGDMVSDALAGHHAGCRGVILLGPGAPAEAALLDASAGCKVVPDFIGAVEVIVAEKSCR